jgi:tetratricopeptide (TPR) repeat protein
MFCLLALLVMAPDFTPRRMLAAIPLFVCALLSKESAVVFPLLAMTCIFLQRKDLDTYIRTEFLWLTDGIYLGLRFHGGGGAATPATAYSLPDYNYTTNYAGDIVTRIYTSLATLPDYARLLLWPVGLHEERSFPIYADPWHGAVIAGAILVLAALAIIICCRASWRPLSWGLLWFGAAHGINSGIPLSLDYIIAEHWMYVPSAGLFLGLGQSLASTLERKDERLRRTVFAGGVLVAALLAALTFRQGALWHDVITLFGNTMIYERSTSAAHVMLGNAYLAEGDDDHAIEQYRRAIRMLDKLPMAPANLAVALFARRQGTDVDEAIAAAEHALALSTDPVHADIAKQARETLAALYDYKGDKEKAEMYRQSTSGKN